jgi:lysophospholipase
VVNLLQDNPWNVVAWDAFGHGRSGGLRAHAVDFEAQHQCDMDMVIDQNTDPALPLLMYSHSMGGLETARWLERHSGRASAAVLSAPMLRLAADGASHSLVCSVAKANASVGAEISSDPSSDGSWMPCDDPDQHWTHDCELYNTFAEDPLQQIGPATWGWVGASCDAISLTFNEVADNRTPTMIHQAELEAVVDPTGMDDYCDDVNAAGGNCILKQWPGTFHELPHEINRSEILADVVNFFQGNL